MDQEHTEPLLGTPEEAAQAAREARAAQEAGLLGDDDRDPGWPEGQETIELRTAAGERLDVEIRPEPDPRTLRRLRPLRDMPAAQGTGMEAPEPDRPEGEVYVEDPEPLGAEIAEADPRWAMVAAFVFAAAMAISASMFLALHLIGGGPYAAVMALAGVLVAMATAPARRA